MAVPDEADQPNKPLKKAESWTDILGMPAEAMTTVPTMKISQQISGSIRARQFAMVRRTRDEVFYIVFSYFYSKISSHTHPLSNSHWHLWTKTLRMKTMTLCPQYKEMRASEMVCLIR